MGPIELVLNINAVSWLGRLYFANISSDNPTQSLPNIALVAQLVVYT